ncbi:MAG: hypothetical protein FJZ10_04230 [Candidatus Omnitrophica bacterium]|nr:hypothetical protein [Candidatus Omnitrophota bacterium]
MRRKPKIPLKVELKIDSSLKGRFNILIESIEARALDISPSGIGMLSEIFLPQGVLVDLQFKIKHRIVKIKGEIRSAISVGEGLSRLGIKFVNLNKKESRLIKDFIEEHEKRRPVRLKLSSKGFDYGKRK